MILLLIAWALVATIVAIVGWAGLLETQQQLTRIQARAETVLRAAAEVRDERDQARDNWAHYESLYHGAVAVNAAMLEHIGEEREAAAWKALADSPNYFAQVAASEAKRLDEEWLDLDFSEDQG